MTDSTDFWFTHKDSVIGFGIGQILSCPQK